MVGTIAIVLVAIAIGQWADRRWGLLPGRRRDKQLPEPTQHSLASYPPGHAASTAISATPKAIASLRARRHCPTCRAAMQPLDDDCVAYEGGELLVLRFSCPACNAHVSVYVRPVSG
ncbi:MAG: hypothetical protein AB7P03_01460 [Kofleriaceae bacterium]